MPMTERLFPAALLDRVAGPGVEEDVAAAAMLNALRGAKVFTRLKYAEERAEELRQAGHDFLMVSHLRVVNADDYIVDEFAVVDLGPSPVADLIVGTYLGNEDG